jgi:hypothetical protein
MGAGTPHLGWLVLLILRLEWDAIATYSWGALHWPSCTIRCAMGSRGVVPMSTSEVTHPPTDLDVGVFPGR